MLIIQNFNKVFFLLVLLLKANLFKIHYFFRKQSCKNLILIQKSIKVKKKLRFKDIKSRIKT